ncbi:uncharacterized protein DMENIID0001_054240 [Sergentomyia squamirostris]
MHKLSVLIALFAICGAALAQNGYSYPRPDQVLPGSQSTIRPLGGGTTPSYPTGVFPGTGTGPAGTSIGSTSPATGRPGYGGRPQGDEYASGGEIGYPSQPGSGYPSGPSGPASYAPSGPISGGFPSPSQPGTAGRIPSAPSTPVGRPGAQFPSPGRPGTATGGFPTGPSGGSSGFGSVGSTGGKFDDGQYEGGDYSAIPGQAGVDYPVYSDIPSTSFDCVQQPWPGYYADVEAQCQVFHICALNKTFSFLCPNGTIFSQEHLVCVWWNQFECSTAPGLYGNNAFIYDYSKTGQSSGQLPGASGLTGTGVSGPAYSSSQIPSGPQSGFPSASGQIPSGPQSGYPGSAPGQIPSGPQSGYPGSAPGQIPSGPQSGYPGSAPPRGPTTSTGSYPGAKAPGFGATQPGSALPPPGVVPTTTYSTGQSPTGPSSFGQTPSGPGVGGYFGATGPATVGYPSQPSGPGTYPQGTTGVFPSTGAATPPNREYLPPRYIQ